MHRARPIERWEGGEMPKEKTLEEKLEEASSAVERALEARDKAIQGLMEARMAWGKVWRKLHDESQAEARRLSER